MKCCTMAKQSWRLALVEYLATPLDSNTPSPSELNGHKFHLLLPNVSTFSSKHSDTLVSHHDAQLQRDKRGCTLPELPVGSKVGYRNHTTNQFNIGIISARNSRSYTIHMESGTNIIIINLFNAYKHLCIYICTNLQLQLIYVYDRIPRNPRVVHKCVG